jgi:hypothetical protein
MKYSQLFGGRFIVLIFCVLLTTGSVRAGDPEKVYSKIPIREVTVFKDGHTFVLHEGNVPTDGQGNVVLDTLPNPIMGTFWAYSADEGTKLSCVVSSRDEAEAEKESSSIWEMVKGNVGKHVIVKEINKEHTYEAKIIRLLTQEVQPVPVNPQYGYQPPVPPSMLVLLEVAEGVKAIGIQQIQDITFLDQPNVTVTRKENKDSLTLKLDWGQRPPADTANVGMAYVQLGIRWIPSYRVEIDGQGKALIKLQGTIINELADLEDVKAHLVIGVPRFVFKDTPDPISLQEAVAQLSRHFRPDSSTAYAFSNAVMTQQARFTEVPRYDMAGAGPGIDLGPELEGTEKNEDLFVFSLDHITLKKGQRMVLPIAEYTLEYTDIYTVDLSFAPPLEMRQNFNSDQHLQLARLFHAPKAMHKIRLTNKSEYPLTTAPATIFKDGRILAQGMMTYTTIGGKGDLEITTAVEITVKHSDQQTTITPNAANWNGNVVSKIDMQGTITLTSYSPKPVRLYVTRSVLGNLDAAGQEGQVKQLGHGYDGYVFEGGVPFWWNWCNWPWWWYHFNSIGQADWTVQLEPGQSTDLTYTWHYFWH